MTGTIGLPRRDWMRGSVRFSSPPTRGSCLGSAVSDRLTTESCL